jgi:hypothetical protein
VVVLHEVEELLKFGEDERIVGLSSDGLLVSVLHQRVLGVLLISLQLRLHRRDEAS